MEITDFEHLKEELITLYNYYQPVHKDILIVVRDQLKYVQGCIESIQANTEDFTIFIWDNGSSEPTASYLRSLDAVYHRSEENLGFIIPNNRLAEMGTSPYLILLNSDTIVWQDWDKAMIAWLKAHSQVALVGYQGCYLNENATSTWSDFGYNIDYVEGWSMALSRATFQEFGLFDEKNLQFAYGEDSDLCLRLKEAGHQVYAMYLGLVHHIGSRTTQQLMAEGYDFMGMVKQNHEYLKSRWFPSKSG
ncbi:MAG: glycosyltransferase [Proteobacteria bacterium]|jgi:GT2 family glycosyltransferase|nr:glycosyltransferase [Pseudomonadota bacterium]